jgi:predicted RNA-binding protein with PUA-like domain
MALWLCKQEPSCYSYDDLERDGSTIWDGVSNPLARKHMRMMKPGDRVLFYHTGKEKAVVGEMEVASEPRSGNPADDSAVVVEMRPVRKLKNPVSLKTIKSDKSLAGWDLVRISRLSVVPVTQAQWNRVIALSDKMDKNA